MSFFQLLIVYWCYVNGFIVLNYCIDWCVIFYSIYLFYLIDIIALDIKYFIVIVDLISIIIAYVDLIIITIIVYADNNYLWDEVNW